MKKSSLRLYYYILLTTRSTRALADTHSTAPLSHSSAGANELTYGMPLLALYW